MGEHEIVPMRDEEHSLAQDYVGKGRADTKALAVATTRAAEEVKARMVMAKHCPRDEPTSFARIMKACQRKSLAERAEYQYPRGGKTIRGPSIRLAEVLARAWGNLEAGFIEIEQRDGASDVEAFAWDLETNTRVARTFTVPHIRETKRGSYKLDDPRDIYEVVANQAQRRVRACILGIIPGDVVDAAVEKCQKTLSEGQTVPLSDRVRTMVAAFSEFGVSSEMIAARLGHKLEVVTEAQLLELRRVYTSIKDGVSDASQWFSPPEDPGAADLRDRLTNKPGRKPASPPPPAAPAAPVSPPAEGQIDLGAMMAEANGTAKPEAAPPQDDDSKGMTEKEKERADALDLYYSLCEKHGIKPKSTTRMSLQALQGHIATMKEQK